MNFLGQDLKKGTVDVETVNGSQEKVNAHANDAVVHVTASERTKWNAKSNFSGSYNDLTNKPTTFTPSAHTHNVLSVKSDNYKDGLSLPTTYDRGVTTFFSNNPANKFNGVPYCTVMTIKGYNNMAVVQYIYPYNVDAPIYYRYGLYNSDSWKEWRALETTSGAQTKVDAHANLKTNPHAVTKAQVGLGSVLNYGVATQAEAEAGTSNAKYMTPLGVQQAITKNLAGVGDNTMVIDGATVNWSLKVNENGKVVFVY